MAFVFIVSACFDSEYILRIYLMLLRFNVSSVSASSQRRSTRSRSAYMYVWRGIAYHVRLYPLSVDITAL